MAKGVTRSWHALVELKSMTDVNVILFCGAPDHGTSDHAIGVMRREGGRLCAVMFSSIGL
jgi:hypothetical protein